MIQKHKAMAFAAVLLCALLASCAGSGQSEPALAQSTSPAQQTEAPVISTPETSSVWRIAGLKGPTTMGLCNLMAASDAGTAQNSYTFSMYGSADEVVPLLVKGELDAAAIPANLAAVLYQKTNGAIQAACVNTRGVLYMVAVEPQKVSTPAELAGKTIVITGKGTTPEYVLRYLLAQNGLDPDTDVTIEYCSEATEALARLQADPSIIAMLPQPFVTTALAQVPGLGICLDMNELWQAATGQSLVTGVLVVRKDAVQANPEGFATLMKEYDDSVAKAETDVAGTAALCEKYGIVAKAALAEKALPQCSIVFDTGATMEQELQGYYQILYQANPDSVGGALPQTDFYFDDGQ